MAFALWIDGEQAWAQGLHEYRPMGTAVIALSDRFRTRDFRARRPAPLREDKSYSGLYASLNEVNAHLAAMHSQVRRKNLKTHRSPTPSWI